MFQESVREADRRQKEADRRFEKMRAEADQRRKEIDQVLKETGRAVGNPGNRLGDLIEHLLTPKLHKKFEVLGYRFKRGTRNRKFKGPDKKVPAILSLPPIIVDEVLATDK